MPVAFNEFIVRVYAIDVRRGVEGSQFGQMRVYNPPPVMGQITSYSWIGGALFTWPRNTETDFVGYRITSWLSNSAGYVGGQTVVETTNNSYQRGFSEAEKTGGFAIVNVSIVAIDTFEQESLPQTATAIIEGLNITPTDIVDFALNASKMFSTAIALEGEQFFNNSADQGGSTSPGFVSWNAHRVFVRGVQFNIQAGATNKKYIYFHTSRLSWPTYEDFQNKDFVTPVENNVQYGACDEHPADEAQGYISLNFDTGKYGQIVAVNSNGFYDMAWSAVANQIIGSAYIMNGAINDAHIGTLTAGKITAGSAFVGGVSIGGMTTLDISLGPVGDVPSVSSYLPEGLYITRDFIGYYNGMKQGGVTVNNGPGIISITKDSKMVVGTGTSFSSSSIPGSGSDIAICIPVPVSGSSELYTSITFKRSTGIKSGVSIELNANSPITYEGRYSFVDTSASVSASNEWSYLLKADGTIAVKEGGQIVVGNKNIIMNSAAGTNSIEISPDGGKAGHDYIEMKDGNVTDFFFNGSTHVPMKSLKNIVSDICTSGVECEINGNFKTTPTILLMAPKSITPDRQCLHIDSEIIVESGVVSTGSSETKFKFTPRIGTRYKSGITNPKPIPGIICNINGHDEYLFDEIQVPFGATSITIYFHGQIDIDSDLTANKDVVFSINYKDGSNTWKTSSSQTFNMFNLILYNIQVSASDSEKIYAFKLKKEGTTPSSPICQFRGGTDAYIATYNNDIFFESNSQAQYIAFGANE